jgi:hypothetical protein
VPRLFGKQEPIWLGQFRILHSLQYIFMIEILSCKLRKDLLYFHLDDCKKTLIENDLDYDKSKLILMDRLVQMKNNMVDVAQGQSVSL